MQPNKEPRCMSRLSGSAILSDVQFACLVFDTFYIEMRSVPSKKFGLLCMRFTKDRLNGLCHSVLKQLDGDNDYFEDSCQISWNSRNAVIKY